LTQSQATAAAPGFDELYTSARRGLYGALAIITDDRDLAIEAIDIGFTRWQRKLRRAAKPVPAEVFAAAYKWASRQLSRSSRQLSGFRLRDADEAEQPSYERFKRFSLDERALLVARLVLGWDDDVIGRALRADGVGAALRSVTTRLEDEGYDVAELASALGSHAASFTEPLSRLETVKTKGIMQRTGALLGGAILALIVAGGAIVGIGALTSSDPSDPSATTIPRSGSALTAENAIWEQLRSPVGDNGIASLAHDGTYFYLMGTDNRGRPVMLQSDNGADWAQIPSPAGGDNMWIQQLVAQPGLLMAVGNGFDDRAGREATVVFTSSDGETWSRSDLPFDEQIEIEGNLFDVYTFVQQAVVTDEGFAVLGNQGAEFDPQELLRDVVDPDLFRNGYGTSSTGMDFYDAQGNQVSSMTWEELGLSPEVGALIGGGRPILWTSEDGVDWEEGSMTLPPGAQGVGGYAATGDLEALIVWSEFGGSNVWLREGAEWVRPEIDASLTAITAWGGKLYASGNGISDGRAGVWVTADGESWERRSLPAAGIQQFFPTADGLVAIGWADQFGAIGPATIEVDGFTVLAQTDGRLQVLDAAGETIVEVFADEISSGDEMRVEDPETGELIVSIDRAEYERAWEDLYREAEIGVGDVAVPSVSLLISADGENWIKLQPEDPGFYPQSVAYGNNIVLLIGWSEANFPGFGGGGQRLVRVSPG